MKEICEESGIRETELREIRFPSEKKDSFLASAGGWKTLIHCDELTKNIYADPLGQGIRIGMNNADP